MKASTLLSTVIVASIFLSAGSGMAGDDKVRETIVLKGGSMGSITFPHGRHLAMFVDCKPCHELFPKESQVVNRMMDEGKMQKKAVMNMCKKCHTDLAEKGQKAGPTACKDCHTK